MKKQRYRNSVHKNAARILSALLCVGLFTGSFSALSGSVRANEPEPVEELPQDPKTADETESWDSDPDETVSDDNNQISSEEEQPDDQPDTPESPEIPDEDEGQTGEGDDSDKEDQKPEAGTETEFEIELNDLKLKLSPLESKDQEKLLEIQQSGPIQIEAVKEDQENQLLNEVLEEQKQESELVLQQDQYRLEARQNDQVIDLPEVEFKAELAPVEQKVEEIVAEHVEVQSEEKATAVVLSVAIEQPDAILDMENNKDESLSVSEDEENLPPVPETISLESQDFGTGLENTPITFKASTGMVFAARQTVNNPNFTVSYLVNYPVIQTSGVSQIKVLDSSNTGYKSNIDSTYEPVYGGGTGNLPTNAKGTNQKVVDFGLTADGANNYVLSTKETPIKFYKDEDFTYFKAPNPHYFNKLLENGNFKLVSVEVKYANGQKVIKDLKNGQQAYFTNNEQYAQSNPDVILISNNSSISLIYDETKDTYTAGASFYDYDATNGKVKGTDNTYLTSKDGSNGYGNWGTAYGINSPGNYPEKGNNNKLAFGNANAGTHLGMTKLNGYLVNTANTLNNNDKAVYGGCNFGLASGLNLDGTIRYTAGLNVPKLFNETGNPAGKYVYDKSSLQFKRSGDTYVLDAANVSNGKVSSSVGNLQYFNHPGNYSIWTNNFWPMDKITNKDPIFGNTRPEYKGWKWTSQKELTGKPNTTGKFPPTDDGKNHNQLFGMNYTVDFKLTEDYVGPLDYIFFGDDDMWVFLTKLDENGNLTADTKTVVDIGGVHSSVGQYVNLWDYIRPGDEGNYRLSFFYTERGWSGSSCYMRFTLPSVSVAHPESKTGNLEIEKQADESVDPNQEYEYFIHLTDTNGANLPDEYAYTLYNKSDNQPAGDDATNIVLRDGSTFKMKEDQYIQINYLPIGARFGIYEIDHGNATLVEAGKVENETNQQKWSWKPDQEPGSSIDIGGGNQINASPLLNGVINENVTERYYFKNTAPKTDLSITKNLQFEDGTVIPESAMDGAIYRFRIIDPETETVLNRFAQGTNYSVGSETRQVGADGIIVLKKNETAVFENSYLSAVENFVIQELIPADEWESVYKSVLIQDSSTEPKEITLGNTAYKAFNSDGLNTDTEHISLTYINRLNISLNIRKTDSEGNLITDSSAKFRLYSTVKPEGNDSDIETKTAENTTFYRLKNSADAITENGAASLEKLIPDAEYLLEEIEAPDDYVLLKEPVVFQVSRTGEISLKNNSGSNASMSTQSDSIQILSIKNNKIPDLPEAGGTGNQNWFWAGAAVMAAGLIFFTVRRRLSH